MKISHPENIDINTIKTIIFDWGNVITPISVKAAIDAFIQLGHPSIGNYFEPDLQDDMFHRLETGLLTPGEVYARLNAALSAKLPKEILEAAYCKVLLDTPPIRIQLLENLRPHFQVCLLSNTNSIHTNYYNSILNEKFHTDFPSIFHKIFYSHEMGCRKPGEEIFRKVLADETIVAKETLFLDDLIPNIETARSLGIQTIHVDDAHPVEKIFRDWL